MHCGSRRLAAQLARGILHLAQLGWMSSYIVLESLDEEGVDHFGLVVGDPVVEALIEGEDMARCAGGGEFYGSHLFAAGARARGGAGVHFAGNEGIAGEISWSSGFIFGV